MSDSKSIKELIVGGDVEQAIQKLLAIIAQNFDKNKVLENDASLLGFQFKELQRKENLGLISSEEANLERNKISHAILKLADQLYDPRSISISAEEIRESKTIVPQTNWRRWTLPLASILVLLFLGFLFGPKLLSNAGLSGGYFYEDFSSAKLSSDWKILSENKEKWGIDEDKNRLVILTEPGSISQGDKNLKNQFILQKALPKGDFEIIVGTSFQIKNQNNYINIALFEDDDNFLGFGYWGKPHGYNVWKYSYFSKEQNGEAQVLTGPDRGAYADPGPQNIYFKLTRSGGDFVVHIAFADHEATRENLPDVRWEKKLMRHTWLNFEGKLSLWASNTNQGVYSTDTSIVPESAAAYNFIWVKKPETEN